MISILILNRKPLYEVLRLNLHYRYHNFYFKPFKAFALWRISVMKTEEEQSVTDVCDGRNVVQQVELQVAVGVRVGSAAQAKLLL